MELESSSPVSEPVGGYDGDGGVNALKERRLKSGLPLQQFNGSESSAIMALSSAPYWYACLCAGTMCSMNLPFFYYTHLQVLSPQVL